jgi:hypothetical protein
MRNRTLLALAALCAVAGYGCSDTRDSLLAPSGRSNAEVVAIDKGPAIERTAVPVVLRPTPLAEDYTVTQQIGKSGGLISIPEAGFALYIPENALTPPSKRKTVDITVTALRGPNVAYTFEPHGLVFRTPVYAVQDARVTNARLLDGTLSAARGAYFADDAELTPGGGTVSEFQQTYLDNKESRYFWEINHFSGYLLAADRSRY